MNAPALTVSAIRSVAVEVPMRRPLGTSAETLDHAPFLLVDLDTREGVTGRAYLFCYLTAVARAVASLLDEAARVLEGSSAAPFEAGAKLARRFRLVGSRGPIAMALAAVDVACWDAASIAAGLPLASLLGGRPTPIRAYNSNGLGAMAPEAAAAEALELLEGGFGGVKLRLGFGDLASDIASVRAVRRALPDRVRLMADYNQALDRAEAMGRCAALDGEGLDWIEEPIRHDDYRACAAIAAATRTPIQMGENFAGPRAMADAIVAGACDYVMPDLERIGGVSGWLQAAALASTAGLPMSSHLFPEVSAHLLAVTPTRHWLEYVDWASPILAEPLAIVDGHATASERAGVGLAWNPEAVDRYRVH